MKANEPRLKPGLTAELDFLIDHQEDVLTIPLSAAMAVGNKQIVRVQSNAGETIDREIVLGGTIIGIVIGPGLAGGGLPLLADWETAFSLSSILMAFGVAGSVGLLFGIFPARRPAQLDPIKALRFE